MPGWNRPVHDIRRHERQPLQQRIILLSQRPPALNKIIQMLHLAAPESRLDIRHAIIIAEKNLLIIPCSIRCMRHLIRIARNAVASIKHEFLIKLFVICQHHTAFTGRNDLYRMETEHRHIRKPATADLRIKIIRSHGMRSIFQ